MVANNVRVELVRGPYDGCHGNFRDVLLRSTIELPAQRLGIEVEETRDLSLAIYKLGDCERISTPGIAMTVLRYHHAGFRTALASQLTTSRESDGRFLPRIKRMIGRTRQAVRTWMLAPIEYPLQLANRE